MYEVIKSILDYLIANYALYMVITMSVIISLTIALLTLIKKPIKKLTAKISNERLRKLTNKMFIIFAFGISGAFWLTLHLVAPAYFSAQAIEVLITGAFSIVVYALGDGVITKPTAENLIEEIKEIDEKATEEKPKQNTEEKPKDAIKDFWKMVKK